MALFGGRADKKQRQIAERLAETSEPDVEGLSPAPTPREIDKAGDEVREAVSLAQKADIRSFMLIEHGRCPECKGRTDNFLFTVICPTCGWYMRENPGHGKSEIHCDDGTVIDCDTIYRVRGEEILGVKNGVVIAQVMRRHVRYIQHAWSDDELTKASADSRKRREGVCAWCDSSLASASPEGFEDYVAFGSMQERYLFCSEECMNFFRKRYPSRVHRNCYETDCRSCDKCIKRFDTEGFRRTLL